MEPRVVVPLQRREEQRGAERFDMELPLTVLEGGGGVTRDLSVSGISFSSAQAYAVGRVLDLTVEYHLDGESFPLRCQATVVRCEPGPGGYTIGARLAVALLD